VSVGHWYLSGSVLASEIIDKARRQQRETGDTQWVHHHAHEMLCTPACGPVDPPEPDDTRVLVT
jgi:hypothetical protein